MTTEEFRELEILLGAITEHETTRVRVEKMLDVLKREKKEYILCVAIWFDDGKEYIHQPLNIKSGYVISGHRHHNCFMSVDILTDNNESFLDFEKEQGFLTNTNRFVDRKEGAQIAFDAGQTDKLIKTLFSENLY